MMKKPKRKLVLAASAIMLLAVFSPLLAFAAEETEEYVPAMYATFMALVPPIVAIVLALITKEV